MNDGINKKQREEILVSKERLIEIARMLLADCDEDIPDEIIYGQRDGRYKKVQVNWAHAVVLVVERTIAELSKQGKMVPMDLPELVEYLTGPRFKAQERKTRKDIELANNGLRICLSVLEHQTNGGYNV